MIEDTSQPEALQNWWSRLTDAERDAWKDRVGRTFEAGGKVFPRKERDLAIAAYDLHITGSQMRPMKRSQ